VKSLNFNKIKKEVERELENVLEPLGKQVDKIVKLILSKKSIFLAGQGRSKIVAEAFAMRLVQLGFKTFIVGEATTPAITSKDLLIAISGSGKTPITYEIVKQAKKSKSKICLITADKKSKTAKERKKH